MGTRLEKLLKQRRAKREDVPVEDVVVAVEEAAAEVNASVETILAAMDDVLANAPEDASAWAEAVATLREQLATLVPQIDEIDEAVLEVETTGTGTEETAAAERGRKACKRSTDVLKAATKRLNTLSERRAERMERRSLLQQNLAAATAHRTGTGAPSMRGDVRIESKHRSRHVADGQRAFDFGRMLQARMGNEEAAAYVQQRGLNVRTMSSSNATSAGLLIPDDIESVILKFRDERGVARRICDVRDMTTATKTIRKQVGGPRGYYYGEGGSIDTSEKLRYDDFTLSVKNVAVATEMYATLDEDAAVSLADEFIEWAGYALAGMEDEAFFAGNGLSTTGGIVGMYRQFQKMVEDAAGTWATDAHKLYHPGVRLTTGNTFASATLAEITGLGASIADRQGLQRMFICSQETYFDILLPKAYTANGTPGSEIVNGLQAYVWNGLSVVTTSFAPATTAANTAFLLYGDPKSYVIGDRRGLTVEFDKNIKTQIIEAVCTARYDGAGVDYGVASATAADRQKGGMGVLVTKN